MKTNECGVVSMPNSITKIRQPPKFKWCVIRCGFKNGHHQDIKLNKDLQYVLKICQLSWASRH